MKGIFKILWVVLGSFGLYCVILTLISLGYDMADQAMIRRYKMRHARNKQGCGCDCDEYNEDDLKDWDNEFE